MAKRVRDPSLLLLLWHGLQLCHGFTSRPRNFHMSQVRQKKKKKGLFQEVILSPPHRSLQRGPRGRERLAQAS